MGRSAHHRSRPQAAARLSDTDFLAHLREQLGAEVDGLDLSLRMPAPVSIRVNRAKWKGPSGQVVPWSTSGFYLAERPAFTFDPLLHAGAYYVQEASSMLLERAVAASGYANERIIALDLCAAPGGKSTHLRSLLHADALVVCNEIDRKRQPILQENLWKWGASNTLISGAAPEALSALPLFFDLIVVDAPCSGEGMFRKDEHARAQWSTTLVDRCCTMQRDAVAHAWHGLKPGGVLIYATCTWETSENEAQVARLNELGGRCIAIPVETEEGILRTTRYGVDALRCYPHRVCGEGFFIAAVRKPGERVPSIPSTSNLRTEHDQLFTWLRPTHPWIAIEEGDDLYAADQSWSGELDRLRRALPLLASGVPLAERKAGAWRPHVALALAQDLDRTAFETVELDYERAISFLRGNAIPAAAALGSALAVHKGLALGWLNGAGNRWNNRWPAPWRIRSQKPGAALVPWAR